MVGLFEMQPSTYHLGECNADVQDAAGKRTRCGRPAVERVIGLAPIEAGGDWRRCQEHLSAQAS
jgi:hypothetical protein